MSKEERQAHRDAVDAYYRQNGIEPPKRAIADAAQRYRDRVDRWAREKGRELPPPSTPTLPPSVQDALDAIERSKQPGYKPGNVPPPAPDTPTEHRSPATPTPKGSNVSHSEDAVRLLFLCRDKLTQSAGIAAQARTDVATLMSALNEIDQQQTEVTGYATQAVGPFNADTPSSMGARDVRAQAMATVQLLANQLDALAGALSTASGDYEASAQRIQAAGSN